MINNLVINSLESGDFHSGEIVQELVQSTRNDTIPKYTRMIQQIFTDLVILVTLPEVAELEISPD